MTDETTPRPTNDDDFAQYDPMQDLMQKLDEMESQENASFRVYRQHSGNTSKMSFLFTVPADQFSLEELLSKIRDEYGGGDFRVHLRGPTNAGTNQLIANRIFSIETKQEKERPIETKTNELAPVVDRLMERIERMEERDRERAMQNHQPPADPFAMMERVTGMLSNLGGFMPQQNQQQKSLLEQMKELKELQEMAGDLSGESNSGFTELVKNGLQPMLDIMKEDAKARKEARESGQPYQPAQPQPQQNPTGNNAMQNLGSLDEGTKAMLSNVRTLLVAAQRNGNPDTYADIVLDFVPEEKHIELFNFLSLPDCIETVKKHFPEVAAHETWFITLRDSILAQFDGDDGPGDTSDHVDGHVFNGETQRAGHEAGPGDLARPAAGQGGDAQDVTDDGADSDGSEATPTRPPVGDADHP